VTAEAPKHRLFVTAPVVPGELITVDAERSHYLCRVLRLGVGDPVLVCDGHGNGYTATILRASTRRCELQPGEVAETAPAPAFTLTLAQSLIKGDRLDFVLQKATELGVTDIRLVTTSRTEVSLDDARIARRMAHWQKIVVAAAEQCERLWLPRLHPPQPLAELVAAARGERLLLEPGAARLDAPLPESDTLVLVGPEGGFATVERDHALAHGFRAMGLGSHVLRADTAPIAALAILRQSWGWKAP